MGGTADAIPYIAAAEDSRATPGARRSVLQTSTMSPEQVSVNLP
jgi:hypothetical protein